MRKGFVLVLAIAVAYCAIGTGCTLETATTYTAAEAVQFFSDIVQWFRDNPM